MTEKMDKGRRECIQYLVEKTEGKRQLERSRCGWDVHIKLEFGKTG
jgi:hypothetical protein